MKNIRRLITIVVLGGALTGCASEIAKPVGLDVALRGVEEDMKAASAVSLHDVLSRDAIQEDEFKRAILQAPITGYAHEKFTSGVLQETGWMFSMYIKLGTTLERT